MLEVNRWCVLSFLLLLCIGQYVIFHMLLETGAGSSQNPTNLLLRTKNYPTNFDVHSDTADVKTIAKEVNQKDLSVVSYNHTQASASKIAILLPYLGKSLPSWFDLFAFSAFASSSLVDWYVFITEAPDRATPSNVHLIRVSRTQMFQRLARLDQAYINRTTGREKLESFFRYIIDVHPYILVEIKPALGFLFADYVEGYSHWAYADLDLLVGNMHLQITPDQLAKYDVITLAFGDNNRLYMRGQLTIHKNTAEVRELWKGCDYLSHIGTRMEAFFEQKKPWAFQSAEGCYSKVVVDHTELSVLYVPVQFSDAFAAPMNQKDTILLGSSLLRCYGAELSNLVMQKASQQQTIRVEQFSSEGLEKVLLGRITNSPHCSYWIDPLYQVCTEYVPANATISIEKGLMTYTQENKYTHEHCREASIAHFQGWKRAYYSYTTRVPPLDAHAMVISDVGVVPLRLLQHPQLQTYAQLRPADTCSYGRIGAVATVIRTARALKDSSDKSNGKVKGPVEVPVETIPEKEEEEVQVTSYCIRFSGDLKKCERYLRSSDIQVLQVGEYSSQQVVQEVTLVSAGWMSEYSKHKYDQMLSVYDGPKVLVLAFAHYDELADFPAHNDHVTLIAVHLAPDDAGTESIVYLPDKTLYNIGLDAAGESTVVIVPSNAILRGFETAEGAKFKFTGSRVIAALRHASQEQAESLLSAAALVVPMFTKEIAENSPTKGNGGPVGPPADASITEHGRVRFYAHPAKPPPIDHGGDRAAQHTEQYCGSEQPATLLPAWEDASSWSGGPSVPFHSQELCREFTVMPPIIFNTSSSPHGSGFVRFPEELNGVGCYGANILRVLAGSGFSLHWYPGGGGGGGASGMHAQATSAQSTVKITGSPANTSARSSPPLPKCGCLYGDAAARQEMVVKMNKYFLKAVELRTLGLSSTYSRERFGVTFEQDQLKATS